MCIIYLQPVQVQGGSDDCGMFVIAFQSPVVLALIHQVCCVHRKTSEATSSIVYKGGGGGGGSPTKSNH